MRRLRIAQRFRFRAPLRRKPRSRKNTDATSAGPTYRQAVDAKRGLTDADRHTLSILAARADARVEREIAADHRYFRQRIGAVADQRRAFHRIRDLALLDHPRFACGNDEFSAGGVYLPAAAL